MRLTLKRPWSNDFGKKQEGVLFLEMTAAVGPNKYDWENGKIILSLGLIDVAKLLHFFKSPGQYKDDNGISVKIFHDKGAGTADKMKHHKTLIISKPSNRTNFFFNLTEKDNGKETKASLPVSPEEAIAFMTLLEAAIPAILSWTAIGPEAN